MQKYSEHQMIKDLPPFQLDQTSHLFWWFLPIEYILPCGEFLSWCLCLIGPIVWDWSTSKWCLESDWLFCGGFEGIGEGFVDIFASLAGYRWVIMASSLCRSLTNCNSSWLTLWIWILIWAVLLSSSKWWEDMWLLKDCLSSQTASHPVHPHSPCW